MLAINIVKLLYKKEMFIIINALNSKMDKKFDNNFKKYNEGINDSNIIIKTIEPIILNRID